MKILHVNAHFGVVGGTESYLLKLIGDLAERGHVSEVAGEKNLTDGTVAPFHHIDEVSPAQHGWTWRHRWRFRRIVRKVQPDLIHLHNTMNPDLVQLAAALRPAMRYVHDHTLFCPGLNKEYADGGLCDRAMGAFCLEKYHDGGCFCLRHPTVEIAERYLRKTERLLAMHTGLRKLMVASAYMRRELEQVKVPADRIVVNPYYTEMPKRSDEPQGDPPTVLTLCRMAHPDKGVIPLLDALSRIDTPFRAVLAGDGQHIDMMKDHARSLGLQDRVEFTGFVDHQQALDLIWQARVIAFPSMWNEPFGIVGIEAAARARPVVAFDVGGVREWLAPDETGLLVERGNVDAFAAALTELLRDGDRARALGDAGPARIRERFLRDRHLDVLEGVYRDIAD